MKHFPSTANPALAYYAHWFDHGPDFFEKDGVQITVSRTLGVPLPGHPRPIGLLVLATSRWLRVACAPAWEERVPGLQARLASAPRDRVFAALQEHFGAKPSHGIKFTYASWPEGLDTGGAFPLASRDYPEYLAFFKAVHPGADTEGWLRDYFETLVARDLCWGIRDGGTLVSVTDAPELPWLGEHLVELGINTHPSYRKRGHAQRVCAAMVKAVLARGMTPLWSCAKANLGSQRLAARLGFVEFAESCSLPLDAFP